ncbi:MAG: alginate lyase family protein [Opitutales bacterium]|nr:alginate lyase family protein [Opitutales bacterium]
MSGTTRQITCLLFTACALASATAAGDSTAAESVFTRAGLTDARFDRLFEALDLSHPELETAAKAYASGDRDRAAHALLRHFADRPPPQGVSAALEPPPGYRERARDVLDDRFTLQDLRGRQPRLEDGGLDWEARGPRDDKEWAWFLNRHGFIPDLLAAHKETGDPRYSAKASALIVDWTNANPYPARFSFSPAWRPLEAARRVTQAWIPAFEYLRHDPQAHGPALLAMLASVPDHADKLDRFASFWGGNHLITEKIALATLAAAWPEFLEADAWFDRALATLNREINNQTYPDGSYKELTNHYQRVVLAAVQPLMPVLRALDAGAADALARRIEEMWHYFIMIAAPDGTGPMNNAADLEFNHARAAGMPAFFGRPDWEYVLSHGARGERPAGPPSRFFPWAGHAVLRGGWGPDDPWLFFDAGPHGSAHQHHDHLNLAFFARGRHLVADSGRYIYQPGPWKDYFEGPRAHNVLLLNGRGTVPPPRVVSRPLPVRTDFSDTHAFAAAAARFPADPARGRGAPRHTRAVLLLGTDHALVLDEIIAFGPRTLEAVWNFHPSVSPEEASRVVRLLPVPADSGLRHTAVEDLLGSENPVGGWFSPSYNLREPALQRTHTFRTAGPVLLPWLLAHPDAPDPEITVTPRGNRTYDIRAVLPDSSTRTYSLRFDRQNVRLLDHTARFE